MLAAGLMHFREPRPPRKREIVYPSGAAR